MSYPRLKERQRERTGDAGEGIPTSFAVVIERTASTDDSLLMATRRSIEAQRSPAVVVEADSGSPLHDIVSRLDADFVLFMRPGDVLAPDALGLVAKAHWADPALELVYFDSDEGRPHAAPRHPSFRPEWSPDMLLGANYIGRAFALKVRCLAAVASGPLLNTGGLWQLLLGAGLGPRTVGRVPLVLLTECARDARVASDADAEMVGAVLAARGETARTRIQDGIVRVTFEPDRWPSVSIVVPTKHSRSNLGVLLPSLALTRYPAFDVTVVDNGGESPQNAAWYEEQATSPRVIWWTEEPFNFSRVNNVAVAQTTGEIIVLLNDDTEIVDPEWLTEMVGFIQRDGVGTVGFQLRRADGRIQHAGVVIGPGGFADNLFSGLEPGADTLLGSSRWYRNSLAVTGACVGIRRTHWDDVGGLDERFQLTGSDVVLGLDQVIRGRRNTVIPFDMVRHYESVTRGTSVPRKDFFASFWRYHPWLQNGDPYSSPSVSRTRAIPVLPLEKERSPIEIAHAALGRPFRRQSQDPTFSDDATALLPAASISRQAVDDVREAHARVVGRREVRTVNWFVPDIDMPYFGGFNTAFRIADKLAREQGILNRFVVLAAANQEYFQSAIEAAFPGLAGSEIHFYNGQDDEIAAIPGADAAVATLWLSAMHVAKSPNAGRKFYLMQDYEPAFFPASTLFAMAEESYKLGLYAICNTESMYRTYTEEYGGKAMYFTPAVDRSIYNPEGRRAKAPDEPVTIFAYARDHFRNCWELVYAALSEIKRIHGDGVRIIAAGARYLPEAADFIDMGLLDYRATGGVYRETDIGITMQISRHPSYLPLELMASGVAMVAPDSRWFTWLFTDRENSLLARGTLADVVAELDELIRDASLRARIADAGLATIDERHQDWDVALAGIYDYLADPER